MASFPGWFSILPFFYLFCAPSRLFCHLSRTPRPVLHDFRLRDQLLALQQARCAIRGQRQWSDLAIERATPLLFGLYSLVALFGQALQPDGHIPVAQAAWYRKQTATFCDVLAVVRRHLWGLLTFPTSPTDPGVVLLPRSTLERLSWAVCY